MEINEQFNKIIIEYYKNFKQIQNNSMKKFFRENPKIKIYCENILKDQPLYCSIKNVLKSISKNIQLKKCKVCGKPLKFDITNKKEFCSPTCSNKDEILNEKRLIHYKTTCIKKYGVENVGQLTEIRNKAKQTCLEKYRV